MKTCTQFAVLLAGYVVNCMDLGTFKSLGVFYLQIHDSLESTNMVLGAWMAMYKVATAIFAPATILAARKFGARQVIVSGAIISCSSLCLASFATSVHCFGVLLFISGVGICMMRNSVLFTIPQYFPDDMNNAYGFMCVGSAVGMMIFPPFLQYLIQEYGWRSGFLVLGALNANTIASGFLIKPMNIGESMNINEPEYELVKNKCSLNEAKTSFMTSFKTNFNNGISYLHFLFIDNPTFVLILVAEVFSGLIFAAWVIYLIPHSSTKGISQHFSAFLSSFGAVGVLLGRLIMGPTITSGFATAIQLFVILGILNAVAFFIDPLWDHFIFLSILAFINGLATGVLVLLSFGAPGEILGEEHIVEGFSVACMCSPIGNIIGGVVLGYFFDKESGTSFPFLGGMSLLLAIIMTPLAVPWEKLTLIKWFR